MFVVELSYKVDLAAIDLEHQLLPNDIIFPAVLAVGLVVAAADPGGFLTHLASGAVLGGFFLGLAQTYPRVFSSKSGTADLVTFALVLLTLGVLFRPGGRKVRVV